MTSKIGRGENALKARKRQHDKAKAEDKKTVMTECGGEKLWSERYRVKFQNVPNSVYTIRRYVTAHYDMAHFVSKYAYEVH